MPPRNNNKCPVCGEAIGGMRGNIHRACRPEGWKPKWKIRSTDALDQALMKLQKETIKNLEGKVKRWNKDLGPEKLKELFPDMVGRS